MDKDKVPSAALVDLAAHGQYTVDLCLFEPRLPYGTAVLSIDADGDLVTIHTGAGNITAPYSQVIIEDDGDINVFASDPPWDTRLVLVSDANYAPDWMRRLNAINLMLEREPYLNPAEAHAKQSKRRQDELDKVNSALTAESTGRTIVGIEKTGDGQVEMTFTDGSSVIVKLDYTDERDGIPYLMFGSVRI